jgi:hypothetical protein
MSFRGEVTEPRQTRIKLYLHQRVGPQALQWFYLPWVSQSLLKAKEEKKPICVESPKKANISTYTLAVAYIF